MTDTPTRADLKPCPFCGATPHRGLTKVKHCQLHGDPYQDFRIWCPHGCAQVERSQASAIAAWNTRAPTADAERIAALEGEVERLREALGDIARDSNPDWTEKRVYPNDVLDDIHKTAAGAYYGVTL